MSYQPPVNYQTPNPSAALPTSVLAIVSLVASLLGFTFFPFLGGIVAVITGMLARNETRATPPTALGDNLATAGIILGWIGVGLGVCGIILVWIGVGLGVCGFCVSIGMFILPFVLALLGAAANSGTALQQFFI